MWQTEFDLQEPSVQGRAIDPEAVDWTFDPTVGRARAAQLDHGWESAPRAPGPGVYYAHGADWGQQSLVRRKPAGQPNHADAARGRDDHEHTRPVRELDSKAPPLFLDTD